MKVHIKLVSKNDVSLARDIYRKVVATGHSSFLLCVEGETEDGFIETMTSKEHVLFAIYVGSIVYGIIWLNGFRKDGVGNTHFCIFEKPPEMTKVAMFREALSLIIGLKDEDGYVFEMLLGLLPESHKPALKFAESCGLMVHYEVPFDVPYPSTSPFTGNIEKSVPVTVTREMFNDISPIVPGNSNQKSKAIKETEKQSKRLSLATRKAILRARDTVRQQEERDCEPTEMLLSA